MGQIEKSSKVITGLLVLSSDSGHTLRILTIRWDSV